MEAREPELCLVLALEDEDSRGTLAEPSRCQERRGDKLWFNPFNVLTHMSSCEYHEVLLGRGVLRHLDSEVLPLLLF